MTETVVRRCGMNAILRLFAKLVDGETRNEK